jgi:dTMP kinase
LGARPQRRRVISSSESPLSSPAVIGLFTFDPHKLQGLSVDIVHGFRPPNQNDNAAGGLGNSAERLGAGFFIAIEGGDGSGKTTQIKRISRGPGR